MPFENETSTGICGVYTDKRVAEANGCERSVWKVVVEILWKLRE